MRSFTLTPEGLLRQESWPPCHRHDGRQPVTSFETSALAVVVQAIQEIVRIREEWLRISGDDTVSSQWVAYAADSAAERAANLLSDATELRVLIVQLDDVVHSLSKFDADDVADSCRQLAATSLQYCSLLREVLVSLSDIEKALANQLSLDGEPYSSMQFEADLLHYQVARRLSREAGTMMGRALDEASASEGDDGKNR